MSCHCWLGAPAQWAGTTGAPRASLAPATSRQVPFGVWSSNQLAADARAGVAKEVRQIRAVARKQRVEFMGASLRPPGPRRDPPMGWSQPSPSEATLTIEASISHSTGATSSVYRPRAGGYVVVVDAPAAQARREAIRCARRDRAQRCGQAPLCGREPRARQRRVAGDQLRVGGLARVARDVRERRAHRRAEDLLETRRALGMTDVDDHHAAGAQPRAGEPEELTRRQVERDVW